MDNIRVLDADVIGRNFIPPEFLPKGRDEYYLRNIQAPKPENYWRHLRSYEIEELVKNANTCDNWDNVMVTDDFRPTQIKNSEFFGLVRIGRLRNVIIQHHDLQMPTGITNSRIIACDIGDDVAIHDVRYLAHYIIGDRTMLLNIDEMHTTNHAKFGNGILKEGEGENVRCWLALINENGGRSVLPFDGMTTADAYLWAKYRDDTTLLKKFTAITQNSFDKRRGYYGTIGEQCVIKNSRIIKDVKIGSHCYIKGANKLKNLTINSTGEEPSQIGEGVELVNGIIGYGCHVFYGCKAVRFIMGNNSNLKYGARLLNSFLGDNSTVSCCEMLNNLIFPAHEQHHNNSFLVASLLLGQTNIAAGASIGSNHNSRANDGEVQAGRGFWPGLCSSIKHSSRFSSFVLLSKADYPAELDIPLPFSLVNNNVSKDRLEVMPAYWWMYNMYALARNSWKYQARDNRNTKVQNIEFDSLAPDTVEEILHARLLLEIWTAKDYLNNTGKSVKGKTRAELAAIGRELLTKNHEKIRGLEISGENMEKSRRKVIILKTGEAYNAYRQMLVYYAVKNLLDYRESNPKTTLKSMNETLAGKRIRNWINLGGQLIPEPDLNNILSRIKTGKLKTWDDIHRAYNTNWEKYPLAKQRHAFAVLLELFNVKTLTQAQWLSALEDAVSIQKYICDNVYISRKKDFDNVFRKITFRNDAEMTAVIGDIETNSYIIQVHEETEQFINRINKIKQKFT
ncbi:DUF4954 family protein [candidate division KSB1 bacterium]|nr:DUF4954 family protein [candidate division KSB1 bacterium]